MYAKVRTYLLSLVALLLLGCTNLGEEPQLSQSLSVEPLAVDFGSVALGDSSQSDVTISNIGDDTLNILSVRITGDLSGHFTISSGGATGLAMDSNTVVTIQFKPTATGLSTASLEIVSDDPAADTSLVSLSGNGGTASVTYNANVGAIIGPSGSAGCASGCHSFVTAGGWTYANIVNVASTTGMNYITPGDTTNSYLFMKVKGSSGISGTRMPRNNPNYFDSNPDKLAILRQWILDGAQEG